MQNGVSTNCFSARLDFSYSTDSLRVAGTGDGLRVVVRKKFNNLGRLEGKFG